MTETTPPPEKTNNVFDTEETIGNALNLLHLGACLIEASTHKVVFANDTALEMMSRTKEEVVGKICHEFMCPAEFGKCPITDLELTVDNSEKILICKNDVHITIQKTVRKVTIGGKDYLLESFFDIKELKEKERLCGILEMAGAAAHHLSQSLQTLTMDINALKAEQQTEIGIEIVDSMRTAITDIDTTIKKMLNITEYKTESYSGGTRIVDLSEEGAE